MIDAERIVLDFLEACKLLRERHGVCANDSTIQEAIMDKLGTEEMRGVLDALNQMTVNQMIDLVRDYNFAALTPSVLAEVNLPSILQIDGVPYLYEEHIVTMKGEKWHIHQNDADPFPHPIHAHSYKRRVKMDLRNGNIYKKRAIVGSMTLSDLNDFRNRVKIPIPDLDHDLQNKLDKKKKN